MIPLLLDALAAYRLTRLVTEDTLVDGPRDAVVRWAYRSSEPLRDDFEDDPSGYAMTDAHAPKLATLVTCRFCASVWIGLGVVAARRLAPRAWHPLSTALAFSAVAGLLAGLEDG